MRVLIVNAYSEGNSSSFSIFESCIKAVLPTQAFTQQRQLSLPAIDFDTVDLRTVSRYLYETGTTYMSKDAEKVLATQLFDHTDIVFVDGDANMLPWFHRAERLQLLFRMCERTKKVIFAAACGLHMLAFLACCAQKVSRVVNGNGKGGRVEDAQKIAKEELKKMTEEDVVLDNATGDIYQYDPQRHEFFPVGNVGIHYHKAAQDSGIARAAILKPFVYVPQTVDDPYPVVTGKLHEAKCRVLKQCNQHWLVQGLGLQEFIVPQQNAWDIHPLNVTQKENRFFVLAESLRGPQIVTWRDHAVGVQFHIDPKYTDTVIVLRNFVAHTLSHFEHERARFDLPLAAVEHVVKQSTHQLLLDRERLFSYQNLVSAETVEESRPWSGTTRATSARPQTAKSRTSTVRPTTASMARVNTEQSTTVPRPVSAVSAGKHSGYAFSKRHHDPLIVGNNATTEAAITLTSARPQSPFVQITPERLGESPQTSDRLGSPKAMVITADFDKAASVSRLRSFYGIGNTVQVSPKPEPQPVDTSAQQHSEKTTQSTYEYKSAAGSEKTSASVWKQQKEIRALLHPGYPIASMPKSGPTIPSNRSEAALGLKKTVRLQVKRVSYTSIHKPESVDPFPKTRTTSYPNLGLTIANDGSVYKDPDTKAREEAKESKKKWVDSRGFDLALGKAFPAPVKNYVRLTPSEPPGLHEFRTEDKEKWVGGQFRVPSY